MVEGHSKKASNKVLSRKTFQAGDVIVRQGDMGMRAYIIENGRAEVLVNEGPHELKVSDLKAGDIFGEMALIANQPRSATVRATEDCTLTEIEQGDLERKMEQIEDLAVRSIIKVLVHRLRETTQGQIHQYRQMADFQDRMAGITDRAVLGISKEKRDQFQKEVDPVLEKLEQIMDKYSAI